MNYRVTTVDQVRLTPAELWEPSVAASIEGLWWYEILEDSGLEDQFQFFYAIVWREDRPVAVAPAFIADVPMELVVPESLWPLYRQLCQIFPALKAEKTVFLGSPFIDEGWVTILPGEDRPAVLSALSRALREIAKQHKAPMQVWKDVPDSYAADHAKAAGETQLFASQSYPGAEINFVSADQNDYFARLKSSHRQQLKRKLRKSETVADLARSVVQAPDDAVLDQAFGLFMQTYERATVKFERLNPQFFARAAQDPRAHYLLLRHKGDGQLAAFMLLFDLGETVVNKFIGLDYRRPKDWMLYFRLTEAAIDWTLSKGARRLQSGQTGYRVKMEMGHSLRPLTNYARHDNPLVHQIYKTVGKTITWATLEPELADHLDAHPGNPLALPGHWD